ncbi:MAG: VOC family protein [Eubacteriales bacterium]|nr:VOC family protein [Eubacteriales bacterium]
MSNLFDTTHIVQLGLMCEDLESIKCSWAGLLQTAVPTTIPTEGYVHTEVAYKGEPARDAGTNVAAFEFGSPREIEIEIQRPIGKAATEWRRYLNTYGDGLHHVCIFVKDLPKKIELAEKAGIPACQTGYFGLKMGRYAYLDSFDQLKLTLELQEMFESGPQEKQEEVPFAAAFPRLEFGETNTMPKHIGIVVRDLDAVSANYTRIFDVKPEIYEEADCRLAVFALEGAKVKLVEPKDVDSIWSRHLAEVGEGSHHIAFETDQLDTRIEQFAKRGWKLLQKNTCLNGRRTAAFFDTKADLGVYLELYTE